MLDPRFRSALPPVLALLLLAGCGGGAEVAEEPATAAPDATAQTPASTQPRVHLVVTADEGEFRTEGAVDLGQLLTVTDAQGNGLGFRPVGIEPQDPGSNLVSIDVIRLARMGTRDEPSEVRLAGLKIQQGGSGTIDPGDGEGTFTVVVESVSRP